MFNHPSFIKSLTLPITLLIVCCVGADRLEDRGGDCDGGASNSDSCYYLAISAIIFSVLVVIECISQSAERRIRIQMGKKNQPLL